METLVELCTTYFGKPHLHYDENIISKMSIAQLNGMDVKDIGVYKIDQVISILNKERGDSYDKKVRENLQFKISALEYKKHEKLTQKLDGSRNGDASEEVKQLVSAIENRMEVDRLSALRAEMPVAPKGGTKRKRRKNRTRMTA